jgi:hypothetical protein
MADEPKKDNQGGAGQQEPATPAEPTPGKQSNNTFTQSEFDKKLKESLAAKQQELDELKKASGNVDGELEELRDFKKKAELEKMSEAEKLQAEKEAFEKQKAEELAKIEAEKINNLRMSVLTDTKYSILPSMARKVVEGKTEDEIKSSADKILEDYQEHLKSITGKTDFGTPPGTPPGDTPAGNQPKTFKEKLDDGIKKRTEKGTMYV